MPQNSACNAAAGSSGDPSSGALASTLTHQFRFHRACSPPSSGSDHEVMAAIALSDRTTCLGQDGQAWVVRTDRPVAVPQDLEATRFVGSSSAASAGDQRGTFGDAPRLAAAPGPAGRERNCAGLGGQVGSRRPGDWKQCRCMRRVRATRLARVPASARDPSRSRRRLGRRAAPRRIARARGRGG